MEMMDELNQLFHDYLKESRFRYGIEVQEAAPDLSTMVIRLTFLSANTYCCAEPHCHLGMDLSALRELASKRGLHLPPKCVVHIHGIVERGALLEYGEPDRPLASEAYEYDADLFDGYSGQQKDVNE
jgi:hypothetical protein